MAFNQPGARRNCSFCSTLGRFKLENKLKTIEFSKWTHQALKDSVIDLGHGFSTSNPYEASKFFIKREIPEVLDAIEKPHSSIFIPEIFIHGDSNIISKVFLDAKAREGFLDEKKNAVINKNYEDNLAGIAVEKQVYLKLKETLGDMTNVVVIRGWKFDSNLLLKGMKAANDSSIEASCEFDYLVVLLEYKAIIHIEVKKTFCPDNIKKGKNQLGKGLKLLSKKIPFPSSCNWHCFSWIYFEKMFKEKNEMDFDPLESEFCKECQKFMLGPGTDLKSLVSLLPKLELDPESLQTYINIVESLVFEMHLQRGIVTSSDLVYHANSCTDKSSLPPSIIFWSKSQLDIMGKPEKTRVAFLSLYGTGKTILIIAKAKELIRRRKHEKNPKEVILIIFDGYEGQECLLARQYITKFKKDDLAEVLKIKIVKIDSNTKEELSKIFNSNSEAHFFMDEVPVGKEYVSTEFLNSLSESLESTQFLWFAAQSQTNVYEPDLKGFFIPELTMPLRYTGNILKISLKLKSLLPGDTSFPDLPVSVVPDQFLNKGPRVVLLKLENESSLTHGIEHLIKILDIDNKQTIIKMEAYHEKIKPLLQESVLASRLVFPESPEMVETFLCEKNNKILVVLTLSDGYLKGIDVPCLVLITQSLSGADNDNAFSRCKSKLIILGKKEDLSKIEVEGATTSVEIEDKWMPESLIKAIKEDDAAEVNRMLSPPNNINANIRDSTGLTGLMIACIKDRPNAAKVLLKKGTDPEAQDTKEWRALHYAASAGSHGCLQLLISKGVDVKASFLQEITKLQGSHSEQFQWIETALSLLPHKKASFSLCFFDLCDRLWDTLDDQGQVLILFNLVKSGHADCLQFLISKGADPNISNPRAFETAALRERWRSNQDSRNVQTSGENVVIFDNPKLREIKGYSGFIFTYIDSDCLKSEKSISCTSLLQVAAMSGNLDCLNCLKDENAEIESRNSDGMTALHLAAMFDKSHCLQSLLYHPRANYLDKDHENRTPLHIAVENSSLACVKKLAGKFGALEEQDKSGRTPLLAAVSLGSPEVVKELLSRGAKTEAMTRSGLRPLHIAAANGRCSILEELHKYKACIHSLAEGEYTPIHIAADFGQLESLIILKQLGANINSVNYGFQTPLQMAAASGHTHCVEKLIELGANISDKDRYGRTSLHLAAFRGHPECCQLLIDSGADKEATDNEGSTALHLVGTSKRNPSPSQENSVECAKILFHAGASLFVKNRAGETPQENDSVKILLGTSSILELIYSRHIVAIMVLALHRLGPQ